MSETEPPIDDRASARREGEPETWDGKAVTQWMSTPHGRRLMERFLDHCGAGQRLYRFDGDQLGLAWRDGLADAGRFWEALLTHHCPDLYLRMIRERASRIARAQEKVAEKEARREAPKTEPLTVTTIEDLADAQRVELEEAARREADEAAKAKKTPKAKPPKD